jgi:hypothetical protein
MFSQESSSCNPAYRLSCLVSLLLSSWLCRLGAAGATTAQIVGTGTSSAPATVPAPHLLGTGRTGRGGEENNHSLYCASPDAASTTTTASRAPPGGLFTAHQHESFARDGFLVAHDLFPRAMLEELTGAGEAFMANAQKMEAYFSSIEMGMIFQAGGGDGPSAGNTNRTITKAFRNVAFDSVLPRAAAELMQLSPSQHVRVLR